MNRDERKRENPPENVVDIKQFRSRKERRKAQQAKQWPLMGTFLGETASKDKAQPHQTGAPRRSAAPKMPAESSGQNAQTRRRRAARRQDMPRVIRTPEPATRDTAQKRTGWANGIPKHLIGAMVAGCIVLAVAIMVALGMNLFVVRNIEVVGGIHYTPGDVIRAAGLREGQSIFSVNTAMIRSELQSTPQLQLVEVDRQLPNTVILTVKETTPTLVASYMNQFITLDEQLRVLSQEGALPEGDYPLVTGMVVRSAEISDKITIDDKLQMEALETIVKCFSVRSDSAQMDT